MRTSKTITSFSAILGLVLLIPACGSTSPSDGVLGSEDLVVGTGAAVVAGDTITVTYVGSLVDGTVFETNTAGFTFRVGVGAVIKGWDQGLIGMRVGGQRRLTIPPNLGYGSQGQGSIPANSTLKFDIGLRAIAGK